MSTYYTLPTACRNFWSVAVEPVARFFTGAWRLSSPTIQQANNALAPMVSVLQSVQAIENSAPCLSHVQQMTDKVVAHSQVLTHFAEELKIQSHEIEQQPIALEKTLHELTSFCQHVTEELEPVVAEVPVASLVGNIAPNQLSKEMIDDFVEGLLHNRRSTSGFMAAFVTASYQRPNGYELCLAVVGSAGDFIGRAGVEVLRNLSLIGFKQVPEVVVAHAIAAVVNCCWALESATITAPIAAHR